MDDWTSRFLEQELFWVIQGLWGISWGYIGIMEKNIETAQDSKDSIGFFRLLEPKSACDEPKRL